MSNLIVFCRVAPKVHPILTKSYNPASLITAAKRNTFFQILYRNLLMTYSLSFCYFYWWRTTAIPHWLDYVTKSEVDITALFYYTAPDQVCFLWPVVFIYAASKPLIIFREHYTLQTILYSHLIYLPIHRLLFSISFIQYTNH